MSKQSTRHAAIASLATLFVLVAVAAAEAQGTTYHSDKYGYSIDVPEGWERVSDNVLAEVNRRIYREGQTTSLYDAALRRQDAVRPMAYPYVLIQVIPYDRIGLTHKPTIPEMKAWGRQLANLNAEAVIETRVNPNMGELIGEVEINRPVFDESRHRLVYTIAEEVEGVGWIKGYCTTYFGSESIVQVLFYCRMKNWDQYENTRKRLTLAFSFDPSKAYNHSLNNGESLVGRSPGDPSGNASDRNLLDDSIQSGEPRSALPRLGDRYDDYTIGGSVKLFVFFYTLRETVFSPIVVLFNPFLLLVAYLSVKVSADRVNYAAMAICPALAGVASVVVLIAIAPKGASDMVGHIAFVVLSAYPLGYAYLSLFGWLVPEKVKGGNAEHGARVANNVDSRQAQDERKPVYVQCPSCHAAAWVTLTTDRGKCQCQKCGHIFCT